MFGSESDFDEQSDLLCNGKRYKGAPGSYIPGQNTDYTSLSLEESEFEENPFVGNPPITPQQRSVIPKNPSQSKSNPSPSSPVAGQSTSVSSLPPVTNLLTVISIPPPPPPRFTMAHVNDDIKLPIFKGTGSEDPKQFWFLCEAVWTAKNIMDQNTRRAQLVTSFRDYTLTWFMNFSSTQNYALDDIKKAMIK